LVIAKWNFDVRRVVNFDRQGMVNLLRRVLKISPAQGGQFTPARTGNFISSVQYTEELQAYQGRYLVPSIIPPAMIVAI
jgi:hypothetical protein